MRRLSLLSLALVASANAQEFSIQQFGASVSKRIPIQKPLSMPQGNEDNELEIVRYGTAKISGKAVTLRENCEIRYRGYQCFADEVDGDKDSQIFRFSGNVRLIGKDQTVVGEAVTVDFKRKTFTSAFANVRIAPNLTNNQLQGDVYLSGKQASGNLSRIQATGCTFTSCEFDKPHFHLDAKSTDIKPNKEIIFREVTINILGKSVLKLPLLWIPLGDRSVKYLPQLGQTEDEGFFIKNLYGFPMKGEDRGALRLDYMSKIGQGIGGNYYYRNKNTNGILRTYGVFGNVNTFNGNLQHEQKFNWGNILLDQDFQQNNYLTAPSATIENTRIAAAIGQTTNITFARQAQKQSGFSNSNQTITLGDRRQFGRTTTSLDTTFNTSSSSSGATRQTVDVRFQAQSDIRKATASVEYQRTIPIGEVANFFPGADRTPVLTFRSDGNRLLGSKASKILPFQTELSTGEFLDPVSRDRITRTSFGFNFNRATRDKGPWRLDLNGNFQQGFYSDDTAQYRVNFGTAGTYSLGKDFSANLRYSYLRPFGYSPLTIDRVGNTNYASFDVSWMTNSRSSFGIQTGYDIERSIQGTAPWQQVGIRSEYRLDKAFSLRSLSTYDTFNSLWSNVRIDAQWQRESFLASLGLRFDAQRSTWAAANLYLDGWQLGKTRIGTTLNYNGYSKQFDSQQYNFVYDLHDAEAILTISDFGTGFRSGREIGFFVRLKIIPFDTNFGFGRRGQPLGSGTGRDF